MRRVTLLVGLGVLLLLVAGVLVLWPRRPVPATKVSVAFCGFSNQVSGVRLAGFRVTNPGRSRVFRWPSYFLEDRGRAYSPRGGTCGAGGVLAPGQSALLWVPAPTNTGPWRALFITSEETWRRKLMRLPLWSYKLIPSRLRTLPVQTGRSDWIGDISNVPDVATRSRVAAIVGRVPAKPPPQTNTTAKGP